MTPTPDMDEPRTALEDGIVVAALALGLALFEAGVWLEHGAGKAMIFAGLILVFAWWNVR